jgi:mitochondrial distribution and morphology protein 31
MSVVSAFPRLTRICQSQTTAALRSTIRYGDSLDRYNIIRTFFIQQRWHTTNHTHQLHTNRRILVDGYFSQKHVHQNRLPFNFMTCPSSFRLYVVTRSAHEEHSTKPQNKLSVAKERTPESPTPTDTKPPDPPPPNFDNYPQFFRRLALSLPHLHRPTLDDFLNTTTGFWQRLRIRFRWFTIRSFRRFNADDISAFITLLLMSQTVWILVGTYAAFIFLYLCSELYTLQ